MAECVAHLNLTSRAYLPLVDAALADARRSSAPVPARYRRDPLGWLVGVATGPLPNVGVRFGRIRTAPAFEPSGALARSEVVAEFDRLQDELLARVRAAEGLPLQAARVTSPFDRRVRYNLYACLVMLPGHQHRHLAQAERVWTDASGAAPGSGGGAGSVAAGGP